MVLRESLTINITSRRRWSELKYKQVKLQPRTNFKSEEVNEEVTANSKFVLCFKLYIKGEEHFCKNLHRYSSCQLNNIFIECKRVFRTLKWLENAALKL